MASRRDHNHRRTAATSKIPREGFSFEVRMKLLITSLCVPVFALCAVLLWIEHVSLSLIIGSLTTLALVVLLVASIFLEQVVRPLQTLANVVAALREEDFSFRARGATPQDSMGELAIEINQLADALQSQRLGALEAVALLRRVILEMDAPVLAFDEQGALRVVNPAAERVLHLVAGRDLGRTADELGLRKILDEPDEGITTIADQGQQARWMVRRSSFRQRGVPHTLLVLSDVSAALREEERLAWRRLIRVLGHELSNSLAPIKSIAETLRSRISQLPPENAASFERGLTVIESRAEALNRFVQAYRQLATLPAPVLKRVPLSPLLDRVAGLETRLVVEVEDTQPVNLKADPDQMEQLLINLVKNAVDAAVDEREEAGLVSKPAVRIRSRSAGDMVSILIEDNGPGLTNPSNLFVPFYTTKKSGTGVGLVLARQIAEAHGGSLELRNRMDVIGCQAEVRIPIASPERDAPQRSEVAENESWIVRRGA
ncbi:sensor histidine kinase [Alloacidobacterium sp.]|uniref:sensor histidine kinase n=1 Tax=Alloacidobacterium sp. TaxID=2951999 RepID=UPI002D2302F1|nr:ATP-binding protein [Alloacidobacterium sp.]HYK35257.1 ATP-binding protein [Alloacidobacterium sp.]